MVIVSIIVIAKVIYKQVCFILNWICSLVSLYSLINVLQDKTYKLNTIYISQYMSRSSIIAMTNHMIIMVSESDSCMFVFTCKFINEYSDTKEQIQLSIKQTCLYITLHMSSDDDC
jgi:hypothetical protein